VKLPFARREHVLAPEPVVDLPWETLVLVCTKCDAARRGPDAHDIRKTLKSKLGKPKNLRIVEVDCLKVCPDDAVTVCVVHARQPPSLCTISSHEALDQLAATLERGPSG
jgi:hypothetical protein